MKCPLCDRECSTFSTEIIHHLAVNHNVEVPSKFTRDSEGYAEILWQCGCGVELSTLGMIAHMKKPAAKGCLTLLALQEAPSAF